MMRRCVILTVLAMLAGTMSSRAEERSPQPQPGGGRAALWTVVGAGAGFGIGLWAGLTVFDDAINSDRKVWTTAILSAAAGGALGYLIGRDGSRPSPQISRSPWSMRRCVERLPAQRTPAPPIGSGAFGEWLDRSAGEEVIGQRICSPKT